MKTCEVIKALMEKPDLNFKNLRFGGIVGYKENGALSWLRNTDKNGEAFTIHFISGDGLSGNWNDDWELVSVPVDFMTAINSEKKIRPDDYPGFCTIKYWFDHDFITRNRVNGKWYIES